MLTERQNLIEVMKGGHPDRFACQYDAFAMIRNPVLMNRNTPKPGELNKINDWGCTVSWAEGQPGAFPVHTPETIVIKDMEDWQEYVHAPRAKYSEAEWEPFIAQAEAVDRNEKFVTGMVIPGIFEHCHYLGEIVNICAAFYEYPDELKDLIKYITEWELEEAEDIVHFIHPDALFHHDDWGTQQSTFMSPEMFEEFLFEPYKEIYGYFKANGVEVIIHHSDSYAATLVPYMIDMGMDIWQGTMDSNNIPELIEKYGNKLTYMGGIDSAWVDRADWDRETVRRVVREVCDANGPLNFAPCTTQGGAFSTFPGVYEAVQEEIRAYSEEYFKTWKNPNQ